MTQMKLCGQRIELGQVALFIRSDWALVKETDGVCISVVQLNMRESSKHSRF